MKNLKFLMAGVIALASSIGFASAASLTPIVAPITNGGDFSGDNLNPTDIGTFSTDFVVAGTVVNAGAVPGLPAADVDVFTFTIADGFQLSGIILSSFVSQDDLGFLALNTDSTFPFNSAELSDPTTDITAFDAGLLFGLGTPDILAALIASPIGGGLTTPITGDVTLLIQQLGPLFIDYELTFLVTEVPLPPAMLLFGAGLAGLAGVRRKGAKAA